MRELSTPAEVAARLKITPRQVYRLIEARRLEATRLPGTKTIRVYVDSVDAYLSEGEVHAAS